MVIVSPITLANESIDGFSHARQRLDRACRRNMQSVPEPTMTCMSFECRDMGVVCRLGAPEREVEASVSSHVSTNPSAASQCAPGCSAAPSASSCHEASERRDGGDSADVAVDGQEGPGLRKVREFILKIRPSEADESSGPSWQELQLQPTPTLLPELR